MIIVIISPSYHISLSFVLVIPPIQWSSGCNANKKSFWLIKDILISPLVIFRRCDCSIKKYLGMKWAGAFIGVGLHPLAVVHSSPPYMHYTSSMPYSVFNRRVTFVHMMNFWIVWCSFCYRWKVGENTLLKKGDNSCIHGWRWRTNIVMKGPKNGHLYVDLQKLQSLLMMMMIKRDICFWNDMISHRPAAWGQKQEPTREDGLLHPENQYKYFVSKLVQS